MQRPSGIPPLRQGVGEGGGGGGEKKKKKKNATKPVIFKKNYQRRLLPPHLLLLHIPFHTYTEESWCVDPRPGFWTVFPLPSGCRPACRWLARTRSLMSLSRSGSGVSRMINKVSKRDKIESTGKAHA